MAKNDTAANTQAAVSGTLTQNNPQAKNIIMMIPDGQSVTDTTLARWYKGGTPLTVDEMMCGLVRTYSSDAAIADSAPSGTAYATGFKSHTGFVGVCRARKQLHISAVWSLRMYMVKSNCED